jgi:membrane protease YdiL (CAAX protease family)
MDESQANAAHRTTSVVPTALAFEGGMVIVACAVGAFLKPPLWDSIVWQPLDIALGFLATIPMVLGLVLMRRIERGPLGRLNTVVDQFLIPLFSGCTVIQLASISIVAGIGEELLFRGVLQPLLIAWLGLAAGLILASAVFGLLHAVTPTYAVLAGLIGAYFGWLAHARGNLMGPIIAHGLYDFVALIYLTRRRKMAATTPPAA